MFGIATFATLALAVSSVSGAVVPRRNPPKGWLFNLLEPYQTYHTRYLALDCQSQHGTDFFTQCCHPLLANQTLSSRPAQCTPSDAASSSAAAAEPTSTVSTPVTPSPSPAAASPATPANNDEDGDADCDDGDDASADDDSGDDDCDDGDDGDDPAPVTPAATPASSSSATETSSSSDAASSTSSSSSSDPSPTAVSGNAEAPPPPPAASSSSSDPAPTSSSDPAPPAPSPSPSQSSGDSGSDAGGPFDPSVVHTGGFATFYTQDGAPGACGQVHQDSDLIVAMNIATYGDGSNNAPICGKQVHITNNQNGKSVTATVADACPGCRNDESIDLSTGTFNTIADPATGVVPITWQYL